MIATNQKIPKHLKNRAEIPTRLYFISRLFWELHKERIYLTYGQALAIPTSKIEEKLDRVGFNYFQVEEIKLLIFEMDKRFRDYDNAQLKYRSK